MSTQKNFNIRFKGIQNFIHGPRDPNEFKNNLG